MLPIFFKLVILQTKFVE